MNAEVILPKNLYDYYRSNNSLFEEKVNWSQKAVFGFGFFICSILILFPYTVSEHIWIVRIIAGIGIMGFWYGVVEYGRGYFNRKSGGIIKPLTIKKFDMNDNDEDDILEAFSNKDFDKLAAMTEAKDQPIQLFIHEDPKGEIFYCQLMKHSSSDLRALTDVIILRRALYEKYESVIRGIYPTK